MKLKAIMYAPGYGKSRKQLVRSEGARRVKQAEKMADSCLRMNYATFGLRYGMSSKGLVNTGLQQHVVYESVKRGDKIGISFLED